MFKFATNKVSVPKIWMGSLCLYKQTFKSVWYLAIAIQLIPILFALGARLMSLNIIHWYINIAMVLSTLINLYIMSAILHRTYHLVDNKNYPLCDSFSFVGCKFLKITVVMIVGFILIAALSYFSSYLEGIYSLASTAWKIPSGAAFIAVLFLLIFLSLIILFTLPAILFKNACIIGAFTDTVKLVWRNWLRTFIVFFIPSALFMLILKFAMIYGFKLTAFSLPLLFSFRIAISLINGLLLLYLMNLVLVQFNDLLQRKNR